MVQKTEKDKIHEQKKIRQKGLLYLKIFPQRMSDLERKCKLKECSYGDFLSRKYEDQTQK